MTDPPAQPQSTRKPAPAPKLPPAQRRVFDIIVKAVSEAGAAVVGTASVPAGRRAITRAMLKTYCKTEGWWDPEDNHGSRSRLSSRLNELAGKHAIGLTEEHVWITTYPVPT